MRVYPWSGCRESLMVDFVRSDGTRVDGPTDWDFWFIGPHGPPSIMPRHGQSEGFSTHLYYCFKQHRYEVRRTDGTVVRALVFPPPPFEII